jgi:hypothetical protein
MCVCVCDNVCMLVSSDVHFDVGQIEWKGMGWIAVSRRTSDPFVAWDD